MWEVENKQPLMCQHLSDHVSQTYTNLQTCIEIPSAHTAAVEGVTVMLLTDISLTVDVSWKALIFHDFPIDSYTVVYSPVSESDRRQESYI